MATGPSHRRQPVAPVLSQSMSHGSGALHLQRRVDLYPANAGALRVCIPMHKQERLSTSC